MAESRYADRATPTTSSPNGTKTVAGGRTIENQIQTSSSGRNVNDVTSVQNMTPEALASLHLLIKQLQSGGTNEQLAEAARRRQTQDLLMQSLANFTSPKAYEDAKGLMALNMQKAFEQNFPAIQRAIEGSGTSASSMQALLANQLARDSALAASALGAEQARAYASTTAQLMGVLEAATRPTNQVTDSLLKSLEISKNAVQNTQRNVADTSYGVTNTRTITDTPDTTETTVYDTPGTSVAPQNTLDADAARYSALRSYQSNRDFYDLVASLG